MDVNNIIIVIIVIIILLMLLIVLNYHFKSKPKQYAGIIVEDKDEDENENFIQYPKLMIPKKINKLYEQKYYTVYDSKTGKLKVHEEQNKYNYSNNKIEKENIKYYDNEFYIDNIEDLFNNLKINKIDFPDFETKNLEYTEDEKNELLEPININDYGFKLSKVNGGDAYYELVKLTDDEKYKFYGSDNIINQQNSQNLEDKVDLGSESELSETTNNEISSLISNSFTDISSKSFDKVNELITISINGELKTITQNQLENIKKSITNLKQEIKTLSNDIIKEITDYIMYIVESFGKCINQISTYISTIVSNPINILIKWLTKPKTITVLGATAIKIGIKNLTNLVKIIHPYEFLINMIYNNTSSFITILRTFYSAVIHSEIIKKIRNAFNSIIEPFKYVKLTGSEINESNKINEQIELPTLKNEKLIPPKISSIKYIGFLKPYISSLYNIIAELFNLATPKNLEKLLQDCLKIIFEKNKNETENLIGGKKLNMNSKEIKRKVNEIFDILKEYLSKVKDSLIIFKNNFNGIFNTINSLISGGDVNDYIMPDEELDKLDF